MLHLVPPKRSPRSFRVPASFIFASSRPVRYAELGSAHRCAHRSFNHALLRPLIHCTALLRLGCRFADSRCAYRSKKVSRYLQKLS